MISPGIKEFFKRCFPLKVFIPCPVLLFEKRGTFISTNHLDIGRFYMVFGF